MSTSGLSTELDDDPSDEAGLHAVLVSGNRPGRPGAISTSVTFGHRALLKIKHVPEQLFDVTAFPVILTLTFTFLFGGALAGSIDAYVQIFLPGILVQAVVMVTMYTGVTLATDIGKGVFDRFRSLPIWRPAALVGALLADVVRFSIAAVVVVALGLLLGFRPAGGVPGVIAGVALVLVFAFSLSWAWTLLGLLLRTPNAVMSTSWMVLFPLTFGSNVFVDPATMPDWLRSFVEVNPITHVVTAVRGLMQGAPDVGEISLVLIWSLGFVAVFGPLAIRRYGNLT